jgi:NADH-quinone oxidoreductase subunit J
MPLLERTRFARRSTRLVHSLGGALGSGMVFGLLAAVTVLGAIGVITRKNPVHSALLLIATLMSVAGIYVMLEAEFLAAVQVLVYAGGVMVLFLFVIMLVDLEQRGKEPGPVKKISKGAVAAGTVLTLVFLCVLLSTFAMEPLGASTAGGEALRAGGGNLGSVALVMFRYYLLPFELASVLLLVAMVGAIVLGRFKL